MVIPFDLGLPVETLDNILFAKSHAGVTMPRNV